jgi:hypothetical protein
VPLDELLHVDILADALAAKPRGSRQSFERAAETAPSRRRQYAGSVSTKR